MPPTEPTTSRWHLLLGVVLGAAAGFAVAWAANAALVPVLDRSPGSWAELSGPLFNLVPLLTVVGGVAGGRLARRRGRPAR